MQISLKNVRKVYYDNVLALDNFSLNIESKEFVVIAGPSESGKSTLMRIIAGIEESTGGSVYLYNVSSKNMEPVDRKIATIPKNCSLYPEMTVYENLAYGLKLFRLKKDEVVKRIEEVAHLLKIENLLYDKACCVPEEKKHLITIGRALVKEPNIILIDELLESVDEDLRDKVIEDLLKIHKKLGKTFVYVTENPEDIMKFSCKTVIVNKGRVQQVGLPYEIYKEPCNAFVAEFIGYALFEGVLELNKKEFYASVYENKVKICNLDENEVFKDYVDKKVLLGLQIKGVSLEENNKNDFIVKAEVEEIEEVNEKDKMLTINIGNKKIELLADRSALVEEGNKLNFSIDILNSCVFDKETEKIIKK